MHKDLYQQRNNINRIEEKKIEENNLFDICECILFQIPFFIIRTIFMIIGFESVKEKIVESNYYQQHLKDFVDRNNTLKKMLSKKG